MKNHKCNEIIELLSPYIDKELSKEEEKEVKKHLDECSECSTEYTELLELKNLMEKIGEEEIEAPEGFVESVMKKIEEENIIPKKKGKVVSLIDNFFKRPWVPAVIAAMLLVAIYIPDQLGPMMSQNSLKEEDISYSSEELKIKTTMGAAENSTPQISPAPTPRVGDVAEDEFTDGREIAPDERKIIRNGYVSADVTDYEKTEIDIKTKTLELEGYVSASNSYYYGEKQDLKAGNLNLRIPEHKFDEMMVFLETIGKVTNSSTSTNDVSEEFFDINTRINNLRVKENRLLEILSNQGELKDLLAVEKELADTRLEIERLEGRLNFLSGQVAYSTIEINLTEVRNLEDSISGESVTGIGSKIKESIIKSINMIIDLGVKGIIIISSALPFLLILMVIYFILRGIWKKKNRDL